MPIFTFSAAMLIGMGAGLAGNAFLDSSVNVENTCNELDAAQKNLDQITDSYKKLISQQISIENAIDTYRRQAGAHKHNTNILIKYFKDSYKQQQLRTDVSLSIFLFVLILFLLLKKFNVFGNIWNLIVKK